MRQRMARSRSRSVPYCVPHERVRKHLLVHNACWDQKKDPLHRNVAIKNPFLSLSLSLCFYSIIIRSSSRSRRTRIPIENMAMQSGQVHSIFIDVIVHVGITRIHRNFGGGRQPARRIMQPIFPHVVG